MAFIFHRGEFSAPPVSVPCPPLFDGRRGGDPAAPSGTATLLQLSPPRGALVPPSRKERTSLGPHSGGLMGGVCKEQGRIRRTMLTFGY